MKGTGPAHLFIYYQKPYKVTDQGEVEEVRGSREEFFVTDGKFPPNIRSPNQLIRHLLTPKLTLSADLNLIYLMPTFAY